MQDFDCNLTLEQQFQLETVKLQVQKLTLLEVQELLIKHLKEGMIRENTWKNTLNSAESLES